MNCSNCGAYLGKEDAFCGECGQPISRQADAEPGPSPEDVRDLETDLLPPSLPPGKTAPRPGPSAGANHCWPRIAGAAAAAVGLCVCAAVIALLLIMRSVDTPTPTAVLAGPAPLYEDSFESSSGWDVYDDEDTWAGYAEGGYRLGLKRADYVTWANPEDLPQFSDFAIEVDARLVEGPLDNNLGVLVRYQGDDSNFYWFQISSDGFYAIDLMQAGEWVTLVSWEPSTAIEQGLDMVNHLRVTCDGSQFDFFVNGSYLTTVTDATFGTGSIGLAAGTFDEAGVVIEFDNLRVTALEP